MLRNWYAIHTYSGHENKVATNIEKRAKSLDLFGKKVFDVILPTEKESKIRSGKKTEVDRKIYPGYVFVEMSLDDTTYAIRSASLSLSAIPNLHRSRALRSTRSRTPSRTSAPCSSRPGKLARPCELWLVHSQTSRAISRKSIRKRTRSRSRSTCSGATSPSN